MNTFCAEFGVRLRKERERKGLNQSDFGALGGVGKLAQLKYEKGIRPPSAEYLHGIGSHGVDIEYLLFGVRSGPEDAGTRAIRTALLTRGGAEPMPAEVDSGLLADSIAGIEEALANSGIQASPTKRARAIANLYLAFSKASEVDRAMLGSMAALLIAEWQQD